MEKSSCGNLLGLAFIHFHWWSHIKPTPVVDSWICFHFYELMLFLEFALQHVFKWACVKLVLMSSWTCVLLVFGEFIVIYEFASCLFQLMNPSHFLIDSFWIIYLRLILMNPLWRSCLISVLIDSLRWYESIIISLDKSIRFLLTYFTFISTFLSSLWI